VADRMLLQTFRSEDDLLMARDGKIEAIDVMIEVTKNNVRRQREWLSGLRVQAANLERAGKPVPKRLDDGIANIEAAIRDAYATIVERESQKQQIDQRFASDLERFRQLKNLSAGGQRRSRQDARPLLHNIVTCADAAECDRLWERAETYVRDHATTKVQAGSDNLLITMPPKREDDISLILSRIDEPDSTGSSLFLDLQCQDSAGGEQTCRGPEAASIIRGFRAALTREEAP
jgi:hypothetical protein